MSITSAKSTSYYFLSSYRFESDECIGLLPLEEEEEDEIGHLPPSEDAPEASRKVGKVEVEIQERRDTRPGVPHVREWDRGKGTLQCCDI